jgi:RNA ligase
MMEHTVRAHRSLRPQNTASHTKLDEIMDVDLLKRMFDENFVKAQSHPDDEALKVLSYTHNAQYSGRWNEVTTQARGLIIRSEEEDFSDAVVLERPWRKFFTLSQMEGKDGERAWALGDEEDGPGQLDLVNNLDFNAPAEVTDKMDGSLGILYEAPDGELAFSTKGSFRSDQAVAYTKLLRENPKFLGGCKSLRKVNPDATFLFELVGEDNQIVVEYNDDDIVFTGAVDRNTGEYLSTRDFDKEWDERNGLNKAEIMSANTLTEALQIPDRPNREGVVIRLKSDDPSKQMMVKVKQEDYIALHRIATSVNNSFAKTAIKESTDTMGDLIKMGRTGDVRDLPSIHNAVRSFTAGDSKLEKKIYNQQMEKFDSTIKPFARKVTALYDEVQGMDSSHFVGDKNEIMKNYVMSITDKPKEDKTLLLNFFRGRLYELDTLSSPGSKVFRRIAEKMKTETHEKE